MRKVSSSIRRTPKNSAEHACVCFYRPAVDVALLREATTFGSGIGPNSPHIRRFWAALEGMSVEARRLFLRLVWWGAGSAGTTQTSRHRFAGAGE